MMLANIGGAETDANTAVGTATAPLAGAAIVTIAALPAGLYLIQAIGAVSAKTDEANMQLQAGAVALGAVTAGGGMIRKNLDGATALTVNAIVAGTAGVVYLASITATRIG